MKVIEKTARNADYREYFALQVNGKQEIFASDCDDSPEDMRLKRDLRFVFAISELMRRAYEAGVAGEKFELEKVEVSVDDLFE